MYKRITIVSWLLVVVFFSYNLFVWGGLAVTPQLGDQLSYQAPRDSSFLVGLYLSAGRQTVTYGGMSDSAKAFAAARFGEDYPELINRPGMAIEHIKSAQSWFGRLSFYGAPLFLVLSIVLYRFRSKPIRSLGG